VYVDCPFLFPIKKKLNGCVHLAILEEVLVVTPKKKSFAEALTSMPNVGQDKDFERKNSTLFQSEEISASKFTQSQYSSPSDHWACGLSGHC
jgi:hypothetical protein